MDEKPHIWKENTPVNQSEEPTLQWYRTNPPRRVPHCHTIILLHDQASSGAELRKELFGAEMSLAGDRPKTLDKALDCCRWVFPNAPFRGGNFFSDELQVSLCDFINLFQIPCITGAHCLLISGLWGHPSYP